MNDRPRDVLAAVPARRVKRAMIASIAVASSALFASTATSQTTTTAPVTTAPTTTAPATPAPATVETPPTVGTSADWARILGSRNLRQGMVGSDVKTLQILLYRRGLGVSIDGEFGPQTRRAVMRLQKRWRFKRPNGIVTVGVVRKLGYNVRVPQSGAQAPTPAPVTGTYPIAGPNAANAVYLKAFPVAGRHTYFNDYGAPRGRGGHQGTNVMAAKGTPVRAVATGTVFRVNRVESGLGGVYLWTKDAAGNQFYYAHLNTINPEINVGTRVTAGQDIATVGNTGDARYGADHLHFEIRRADWTTINPYTDLLAVDPEPPIRK